MPSKKSKKRPDINVLGAHPMIAGSAGSGHLSIPNPYTDLSTKKESIVNYNQASNRPKPSRPVPPVSAAKTIPNGSLRPPEKNGSLPTSISTLPNWDSDVDPPVAAAAFSRTDRLNPVRGMPNVFGVAPNESYAVAIADFETDVDGDLRFKTGDTIVLEAKVNDEWHRGRSTYTGQVGIFPSNFVDIRVPLPKSHPAQTSPLSVAQPILPPIRANPPPPASISPAPPLPLTLPHSLQPAPPPPLTLPHSLQPAPPPPLTLPLPLQPAPPPPLTLPLPLQPAPPLPLTLPHSLQPAPPPPSALPPRQPMPAPVNHFTQRISTTERPSSLGRLPTDAHSTLPVPESGYQLTKPKSTSNVLDASNHSDHTSRNRVAGISAQFQAQGQGFRPETPPKPASLKLAMANVSSNSVRGRVAALSSRFDSSANSSASPVSRSLPSKPTVVAKPKALPDFGSSNQSEFSSLSMSQPTASTANRPRGQGLVAQLAQSLQQQGLVIGQRQTYSESNDLPESVSSSRVNAVWPPDSNFSKRQPVESNGANDPVRDSLRGRPHTVSGSSDALNQVLREARILNQQQDQWLLVEDDFDSIEPGDLDMKAGMVIRCLDTLPQDSSLPEAWLLCSTWFGDEGRIPSSYVRRIVDPHELASKMEYRPRAKAIADFFGEDKDDLSFKVDEIVYLLSMVDENWYRGESSVTGARGIFPINFVQIIRPV